MPFKKIISISAVNIIKSELIKYDLKKYFKKSQFEIWDLGDFFYKKKIKSLNTKDKINIKHYRKFNNLTAIIKELNRLNENDLIIDPFNISNKPLFSKIIKNKNIKVLFFHLGPIPIINKKYNFLMYLKRFILSPKYYLKRIIDFNYNKVTPDYLMVVNKNYIKNTNYKLSVKTKIILGHSFDYNRHLIKNNNKKNTLLSKKNYAVFLDEGVVDHPDYEYLNLKPYCASKIYYDEINSFFEILENNLNLEIIIAGHPKIYYNKKNNLFKRKIYNNTIELVKYSKFVLSHISTSINFAVIYEKPIFFLDSNNYNFIFSDQIKLHANKLKSKLVNLSSIHPHSKIIFNNHKINKIAYNRYMKNFISYNVNDKRTTWKILFDNISMQN